MHLQDRVFKVVIPTERVVEIKEGGKRSEKEKKIFPGYVLVQMEMDDDVWAKVRNTPGVTSFVGTAGTPAPLTRDEYNKIMHRGGNAKGAPARTATNLEIGQSVKVTQGALADSDGYISDINPDSGKVTVMVVIFGRETPVECTFDQIARI